MLASRLPLVRLVRSRSFSPLSTKVGWFLHFDAAHFGKAAWRREFPDSPLALRTLITRSLKLDEAVRKEGVQFRLNGGMKEVNIEAVPFKIRPS